MSIISRRISFFYFINALILIFCSLPIRAETFDQWEPGYYWSGYSDNVGSSAIGLGRTVEEAVEDWKSQAPDSVFDVRFSHIEREGEVHVYVAKRYIFDDIVNLGITFGKARCSWKRSESICPRYQAQETLFQPKNCEANPCSPSTGAKIQTFDDYSSLNGQGITFKRTYLSQNRNAMQFALGWQHNFSVEMSSEVFVSSSMGASISQSGLEQSSVYYTPEEACLHGWQEIRAKAYRGFLAYQTTRYVDGNLCEVIKNGQVVARLTITSFGNASYSSLPPTPVHTLIGHNGQRYQFQKIGTEWSDWQHPEATLVAQGNNWLFTDANDQQELYDDQGRLIQITTRQGLFTQLQHDLTAAEGGDDNASTLDKVIGPFGRTLVFNYQAGGKLESVNTPDGLVQYSYDTFENLVGVTYPDGKTETYHYEKTAFPHHLTGITDEKGVRFATWDYDDQGRAILSEHAGHADKVTFAYNSDGTTTVTGALGDTRTYHFDWVKGGLQVKKITGDRCQTCGNGHMKERTYDANGFLASHTDWNGHVTTYSRDATGLELSRTEAVGTPDERTITTEWHPDFRQPVKITQPGKITEYSYDAQGRLLTQTTRNAQ